MQQQKLREERLREMREKAKQRAEIIKKKNSYLFLARMKQMASLLEN